MVVNVMVMVMLTMWWSWVADAGKGHGVAGLRSGRVANAAAREGTHDPPLHYPGGTWLPWAVMMMVVMLMVLLLLVLVQTLR
jgi:hypothetical protein